jgi:hypothetical protein
MTVPLSQEIFGLRQLTTKQLQQRFYELFGETARTRNRVWLLKRLAWRVQALAEGDLSQRARSRASELARDADLRLTAPKDPSAATQLPTPVPCPVDSRLPPPGTILTRLYKGQQLHVQVLAEGFAFAGHVYPSLSAVARAITGSHCNGFAFFRLTAKGASR